jgi:hypothetical protein
MNRFTLLCFVFITAGCATPLPQVPPAGMSAQVAAPAVRTGDRWTYVSKDAYTKLPQGRLEYRVASVQGDEVRVEVDHDGRQSTQRYTREGNWLERPMTNLQNFRYEPAYVALPFPLESGKTWQTYVKATDPVTGRTNRVRIDGKVMGWDKVQVPAGEFDAIVVRRLVYAGNADGFLGEEKIEEVDWYAPRIGTIVRQSTISGHVDLRISCGAMVCNNWINNGWSIIELESRGGR